MHGILVRVKNIYMWLEILNSLVYKFITTWVKNRIEHIIHKLCGACHCFTSAIVALSKQFILSVFTLEWNMELFSGVIHVTG